MADDEETQRDLVSYGQLLTLWMQENPIKTTKLQVLLAVNGGPAIARAVLAAAVSLGASAASAAPPPAPPFSLFTLL